MTSLSDAQHNLIELLHQVGPTMTVRERRDHLDDAQLALSYILATQRDMVVGREALKRAAELEALMQGVVADPTAANIAALLARLDGDVAATSRSGFWPARPVKPSPEHALPGCHGSIP